MKKKFKIVIHAIYWLYMFNQQMYYFFVGKVYPHFWEDTAVSYSLSLITFYIFYFTIRYFISPGKRMVKIVAGILFFALIVAFRYYAGEFLWFTVLGLPADSSMTTREMLYMSFRITLITGVYAVLLKLAIDWFESQKLRSEMVNQTQASELALLRSQINPHFLFNTLNNIYSLVYKKSDDAPQAVMKLSSIMRYVLYDATTDMVPLEKEIEYLNSFIELQKLRFSPDFAEFTVTGDPSDKTIAPMLLIPFVENAFKHGNKNVRHPGILIKLDCSENTLQFDVTNSVKKAVVQKDRAGGIGLHNIRRRLDLLYRDRYLLVINDGEEVFNIKLVIYISKSNENKLHSHR